MSLSWADWLSFKRYYRWSFTISISIYLSLAKNSSGWLRNKRQRWTTHRNAPGTLKSVLHPALQPIYYIASVMSCNLSVYRCYSDANPTVQGQKSVNASCCYFYIEKNHHELEWKNTLKLGFRSMSFLKTELWETGMLNKHLHYARQLL